MDNELNIKKLIEDYNTPEFDKLSEMVDSLHDELEKLKSAREQEEKKKNQERLNAIQKMQSEIDEYKKQFEKVLAIKTEMETLRPTTEQIQKITIILEQIRLDLEKREKWIKECFEALPEELKNEFPDLISQYCTPLEGGSTEEHYDGTGKYEPHSFYSERQQRNNKILNELYELKEEIVKAINFISMRPKTELFYQMCIWCGKLRFVQSEENLNNEVIKEIKNIFNILTKISSEHRPGSIIAFRRSYHCNWQNFIEENQRKLNKCIEDRRIQNDLYDQEQKKQQQRQVAGDLKLKELKEAIKNASPSEEFCFLSLETYKLLGRDQRLMNLIANRQDEFTGKEYKALRRALKKHLSQKEEPVYSGDFVDPTEEKYLMKMKEYNHLLPVRKRFAIVGSIRNNDLLKKLERTLQTDEINWIDSEDGKIRGFDSLAQSIKDNGTDAVIILQANIPHNCADLNNVLKSATIPRYYVRNSSYVSIMEKIIESLESEKLISDSAAS